MLFSILHTLLQSPGLSELRLPLLTPSLGTKKLYVLLTSNKGLCGAFHTRLFQFVMKNFNSQNTEFIAFGQKGSQFIVHSSRHLLADFTSKATRDDTVSALYSFIEDKFLTGEYESVSLVYNSFINSMKSIPVCQQIMPIMSVDAIENTDAQDTNMKFDLEPSAEIVLPRLLQDYIREKLRSACADSEASEHSARMMAMKTATDNAQEVTDSLTLMRNTVRQTHITNELLDMVAGMNT